MSKEESCFAAFVSTGGMERRQERRDGFLIHSLSEVEGISKFSFLSSLGGTASISVSAVSMYSGSSAQPRPSSVMARGVSGSSAVMDERLSGGGGSERGLSWGDTDFMLSIPESDSVSIKSQLWTSPPIFGGGSVSDGASDRPGT